MNTFSFSENLPDEIWQPVAITFYKDHYEVSSHGRVRRIKSGQGSLPGKILKPSTSGPYDSVSLSVKQKIKTMPVAQLVCSAFHGMKPTPSHEVNHKDGNKKNNCASNLEWATRSEQEYHKYRVLGYKPNKGMLGRNQSELAKLKIAIAVKSRRAATKIEWCTVEGCGLKHLSKGYCEKHYTRIRRNGSTKLKKDIRKG